MEIRTPTVSDVSPSSNQLGDDLQLSLACPACGASGWVPWKRLQRGMACPKCQCHFHVASNGQLQSDDALPRVRFHCPRCQQAGSIPANFRVRKAKCGVCKLPLEIGPDQQLHGAKEAAQLRRASARVTSSTSGKEQVRSPFRFKNRHMRFTNLFIAGLTAVLLIAALVAAGSALLAPSPEGTVRSFTYTCLAGQWNRAQEFLPDDDVARVEFKRWRSFYFTSILDEHRPAGDKVSVAVARENEKSPDAVLVVTMISPVVGRREIRQHWHEHDGRWEFDVVRTLNELR
jgi:hypothetical protein